MTGLKTIIAAIDLERGTNAVLSRAFLLAKAAGARLIVLHVIETPDHWPGAGEYDPAGHIRREAQAAIETVLDGRDRPRDTEIELCFGRSHASIARIAAERDASLILIGPGNARTLREKILGSTADRVLRTARVPVLIVRKAASKPYGSMVVATDFSDPSKRAVAAAVRLAPEARLQLVHVIETPLTFQQAMMRAGTSQAEIDRYEAATAEKAADNAAEFARSLPACENAQVRILRGDAASALIRMSRSASVDLIAMGPHGRGAVHDAILGSVTQKVVARAACEVLVA